MHVNDRIGKRAYDLLKIYAMSHGLRTFDSLIAAIALEGELTLVTRNLKHFGMIDGIRLQIPNYSNQLKN
jgi:predicted nucleic acid-binding protein